MVNFDINSRYRRRPGSLFRLLAFIAFIIVLISPVFFYFGFSKYFRLAVMPIFSLANFSSEKFTPIFSIFLSRDSLSRENQDLKQALEEKKLELLRYSDIVSENQSLKEILGRVPIKEKSLLAVVMARPDRSPYDTLIIDVGKKDGVGENDDVVVLGNAVIGKIYRADYSNSLVKLFSAPGEENGVIIGPNNIEAMAYGRGGGNFEALLPKGSEVAVGDSIFLPNISPKVFGVVEYVGNASSDTFQKVLFRIPVNMYQLKFVTVMVGSGNSDGQ